MGTCVGAREGASDGYITPLLLLFTPPPPGVDPGWAALCRLDLSHEEPRNQNPAWGCRSDTPGVQEVFVDTVKVLFRSNYESNFFPSSRTIAHRGQSLSWLKSASLC